MADHPDSAATRSLDDVLASWETALRVPADTGLASVTPLVEEALRDAPDVDEHRRLQRRLKRLVVTSEEAAHLLRALIAGVERARWDWIAFHRYHDDQLETLRDALADEARERPERAARRWLAELFDALRTLRSDVVTTIAAWDLGLPAELAEGTAAIRDGVERWRLGDADAGLKLLEDIGAGRLPGWQSVVRAPLRARAYRIAAWVAVRRLGNIERAADHLDAAIELHPDGARNHAERAALALFLGEIDRAAREARRAIELDPEEPSGHLNLGIAAELAGQYQEADRLYRRGLRDMSTNGVTRLHNRESLADHTGRMLTEAAAALLDRGRPAEAVEAAHAAVLAGVRGPKPYADARLQHLLSVALERRGPDQLREAAEAAVEAGKRHLWNGDPGPAVTELRRALTLTADHADASWLLADALAGSSFQGGAPLPDPDIAGEARAAWQAARERFGPPAGATSWAWLTAARIADLESNHPDGDRPTGLWRSLVDVERSLVHDDRDAQRWGWAAGYRNALGLPALAADALDHALKLDPSRPDVSSEQLVILANRGAFKDAEAVADEIERASGRDPWLSGARGWLAYHDGRHDEAVDLLTNAIEVSFNLVWNLSVRALCHLALGDRDAARRDSERVCEVAPKLAVGAGAHALVARAAVLVGRPADAERWLARATAASASAGSLPSAAAAFMRLTTDRLGEGEQQLSQAVLVATEPIGIIDATNDTRVLLSALDDDRSASEARLAIVDRVDATVARPRLRALRQRDADEELAALLDDAGGGPRRTAALAMRARRRLRAGDLTGAREDYEQLRGADFEPEATAALTQTLTQASEQAARDHDIAAVQTLQEQLRELGTVDAVDTALAEASALELVGDPKAAREYLQDVAPAASVDPLGDELHERLGELALASGDAAAAADEFAQALALASRQHDARRIAQIEARCAVAAIVQCDANQVAGHVRAAVEHWTEAGSLEPTRTLRSEMRAVIRRTGTAHAVQATRELPEQLHALADDLPAGA